MKQFDIQNLLFRFMASFDKKNWDDMGLCLLDPVYCDYSSFRQEPPGSVSRTVYIEKRKQSLSSLVTQHNLSNLCIELSDATSMVTCHYAIYRFHPAFKGSREHFFHSYGDYIFLLIQEQGDWKISSITQNCLMNDGNPNLHRAL